MSYRLSLEFARVTENAAIAAARWMGKGKRDEADKSAVDIMRQMLGELDIDGQIVIGEGERDKAPMLYIGEKVGNGGVAVDIAVDPVEGTNLVANGLPNGISVLAVAERGSLLHAPDTYMRKLAVGPKAKGNVHIDAPVRDNLKAVAESLDRAVTDLTVIILDRPRHKDLIEEVRQTGARIQLISDGDTDAAIATAIAGTGIHCLMGIGGAPEGVLAAAAIKCLGGEFQGKLVPRNEQEEERCRRMGHGDRNKVYAIEDLVKGEDVVFVATGITPGDLLKGVRFFGDGARTHTIIVDSKTSTIRFIESIYRLTKRPLFVRRDG
ncbi:MAG: class II fructose-bisphosphatase [Armatimonadetes bacterium]|nr:class II fructose-bisphosphatase [Armatimonadota bacterium]